MARIIKRVLIVLILLFVIICVFIMFMVYQVSKNNKQLESNKVILTSQNGDNKALVLYQPSSTNKTKDIAYEIAKGINDSGISVTINYYGDYIGYDLSEYDIVVFGTPTYGGKTLDIVKKTIEDINLYKENAKIIMFSVGIANETPELSIMEEALQDNITVAMKKKFQTSDQNVLDEAYKYGDDIAKKIQAK
mgnify:CR=1 FL=1